MRREAEAVLFNQWQIMNEYIIPQFKMWIFPEELSVAWMRSTKWLVGWNSRFNLGRLLSTLFPSSTLCYAPSPNAQAAAVGSVVDIPAAVVLRVRGKVQ